MPLIVSFIIGMFLGSFFYTLALRYAGGELKRNFVQALFSRSKCPSCLAPISPLYLVPVLGYLVLRGRCGKCGGRISACYPVMEIAYGGLAVLFAWKLGVSAHSINLYLLAGAAVCIAVIDVKTLTIPNSLVIALVVLSVYPVMLNYRISDNLFGLLLLFGVFAVILLIFPGSFGGGDLKLASVIGFISGLELSVVVLEISFVTGAISGIIYALVTKKGLRSKIPFAPFLAAGLTVSFLFGRELVLTYYRIFY